MNRVELDTELVKEFVLNMKYGLNEILEFFNKSSELRDFQIEDFVQHVSDLKANLDMLSIYTTKQEFILYIKAILLEVFASSKK